MNELLHVSTNAISRWLEEKLPNLGLNWWADNVVNRLTFQQQRLLEEKRVKESLNKSTPMQAQTL
jgi:ATP-dependent helicase HepA